MDDKTKAGFFYLCKDLEENRQNEFTQKKMEYWLRHQKYLLDLLESSGAPSPQREAIHNTIAVLTALLPGREAEAAKYLGQCLQGEASGGNSVANLIHIYRSLQKEEFQDRIKSLEQKSRSLSHVENCLDSARALCERGYFLEFTLSDSIDLHQSSHRAAAEMIEEGISHGSEQGMSQDELTVWRYYSLLSRIHTLQALLQTHIEDQEEERLARQGAFTNMAAAFEQFYGVAGEECVLYKSRALVDVILVLYIHRDTLKALGNFRQVCEEGSGILWDIWEDYTSIGTEAMEMSPQDYYIPLVLAKVYCKMDKFDLALDFASKSLQLEHSVNYDAMETQLVVYTNKAKSYTRHKEKRNIPEGERWLRMAYEKGKEIEHVEGTSFMSASCASEMARVCYTMAATMERGANMSLRDPVRNTEAIHYNKHALESSPGFEHHRLLKQMSECLYLEKNYVEATQYLWKSCCSEPSMYFIYNFHNLLRKYAEILFNKGVSQPVKHDILGTQICEVLEAGWCRVFSKAECQSFVSRFTGQEPVYKPSHQHMKDVCEHFLKRVARNDSHVQTVVGSMEKIDSESAKEFLVWYCNSI